MSNETLAANAYESIKGEGDPSWPNTQQNFREDSLHAAARVVETGHAVTPFEQKVLELSKAGPVAEPESSEPEASEPPQQIESDAESHVYAEGE